MRSERLALRAALLLAVVMLQACSAMHDPKPPPPALGGTAWSLSKLPGATLPVESVPTLRFEDGRVSGSDGCNRFGATFTATDDKLQIGLRMGTQMACAEAETRLATAFGAALAKARTYRVENGRLLLLDAGAATLATFDAQATGLAGTAWDIIAYNNGKQAVVSVVIGTKLGLQFLPDGKLSGSGGCNRFQGVYRAEGAQLNIGKLASTRMACSEPAGRMAQEDAFVRALQSVATMRREGERLELRTATGALAVSASQTLAARP